MTPAYHPINCEFHDVLEATAVHGKVAIIRYLDRDGGHAMVQSRIVDLFAHEAAEYMRLEKGMLLRLDCILSVDGVEQSSFNGICGRSDT